MIRRAIEETFTMLTLIFLILFLHSCSVNAGPVVNWGGGGVAEIYAQNGLEFFDDTRIITGATDPSSVSFDAPNGSIYISTSTNLTYQKQDDGDTTNWNPLYFVPLFADDNRLVRTDGTNDVQQSGISVSDTDDVSGLLSLSTGSATVTGLTQNAVAVPDATGLLGSTGVLIDGTDNITGVNSIDTASAKVTGLTEDAVIIPAADGTLESSGVLVNATNEVSGATRLDVDSLRMDGFTLSTTATDQSLSLVPNGTGTVDVEYLNDSGSAVFTGVNGALSADFPAYRYSTLDQLLYVPGLQADNVQINNNTISTTDTNGNLILSPNGTGEVQISGLTGSKLLESTATGGITESTATTADIEGKLEKFPAETTDNKVVRTDVNGNAVQGSLVEIDDLGAMSGLTDLTVDNVNLDGNTVSSTSGDLTLSPFANLKIDSVTDNQVAYADNTDNITGSTNFLYSDSLDKLRVSGIDFEGAALAPYSATDLGIAANGGSVNVTSPANINNLNFTGSSILGTDATQDLTITAEATRRVEIENINIEDNTISSETVAPLEITSEGTQPVNVNDVDVTGNAISASVLNDDLSLSGNGTGRVKIDRGGTLYEAGSRNPEYIELIDDPSFQAGVSEWSCTNATVEQVDSTDQDSLDHGVDRSQTATKITVTADGGYCEIVKTIGTSQAQSYVPSIYYASSSADAFVELARDSRGRVVEPDFLNTGEYQFASTELLASTGLSIRLGGNLNDEIWADMASMELGGYNRSASKNCSSTLDCENKLGGYYDLTNAIAFDQYEGWLTGAVAKLGASNFTKTITVASGIFSETPRCWSSPEQNGDANYDQSASTATSIVFNTLDGLAGTTDRPFTFWCEKQGDDYKRLEDQGVTIIPDNKDVLLTASNSSETVRTNISSTPTKIDLPDMDKVEGITWDSGTSTGTVIQSGKYLMVLRIPFYNATSSGQHYGTIEIDEGGGAGFVETSQHPCTTYTSSAASVHSDTTCHFVLELEKGDQFRAAAISTDSSTGILTDLSVNGKNVSPRMVITPLGGGKAVVENQGVPTYEGEGGMIAGYASFGGATDGSVCSTSPCTRYREVGSLAQNMSAAWVAVGQYDITISGFKPGSPVDCYVKGAERNDGFPLENRFAASDMIANASGIVTLNDVRLGTDVTNGPQQDAYFQIKCEGPRP